MIMLGVVARFFFIWNSCCKRANYRYFVRLCNTRNTMCIIDVRSQIEIGTTQACSQ